MSSSFQFWIFGDKRKVKSQFLHQSYVSQSRRSRPNYFLKSNLWFSCYKIFPKKTTNFCQISEKYFQLGQLTVAVPIDRTIPGMQLNNFIRIGIGLYRHDRPSKRKNYKNRSFTLKFELKDVTSDPKSYFKKPNMGPYTLAKFQSDTIIPTLSKVDVTERARSPGC